MSLLSEDEVTNLQTQNERLNQVNCLLNIVDNKRVQHNDRKCFNELISFMRRSQDAQLSGLVEKMGIRQDDHDDIELRAPTEQSDVGHGMYVLISTCVYSISYVCLNCIHQHVHVLLFIYAYHIARNFQGQ